MSGSSCRAAPPTSSAGSRPPASARSPCRSAPSRRPTNCGGSYATQTSACCSSASGFRSHDYIATLQQAFPELAAAAPGPLLLAAAPSLRWVFVDGDAPAGGPADRSMAALQELTDEIDDAFLSAVEADVSPSDRMVIVHTSGSTSTPKGVIHHHGSLIEHTDNLNQVRGLTAGHEAVLEFAAVLDRWPRATTSSARWPRVPRSYLVICRQPRDARPHRARTTPTWSTASRRPLRISSRIRRLPARDFSSIRLGNLYPIMPDDVRPADPELRHNMLGMTETGSVCLMSADESDLPERYRGSFGQPGARRSRRASSTRRPPSIARVGELGELWMRGPLLMEGYYGRERHEVFTPDGWFRGGDLFSVDDDRLLLLQGPTRRHDQDRRRERVATRGRVRTARHHPRVPDPRRRLEDAERGQIVVAVVIAPDGVVIDEQDVTAALADNALPLQSAASHRSTGRSRDPDAVEWEGRRQASPRRCCVDAERLTVPTLLRRHATASPDLPVRGHRRRGTHLRRSRTRQQPVGRAPRSSRVSARARVSGSSCPTDASGR